MRRPYCHGSHRFGCYLCAPTRLEIHEKSCRGLRDWWHVLTAEHVRLAEWDYAESSFILERTHERLYDKVRQLAPLITRQTSTNEENK